MKLKTAEIREVPNRKRGDFKLRIWAYYINDTRLGEVWKEQYPRAVKFTYRYEINAKFLPMFWKTKPQGRDGIIGDHYESKKEAFKALRAALKEQIRFYINLLEP